MSWEEYLKSRSTRKDFSELQCPEFWVDLRDFAAKKYGKTKDLASIQSKIKAKAKEDAGQAQFGLDAEDLDIIESVVSEGVLGWNLTNMETGELLAIPEKDISSLKAIPTEFLMKIAEWVTSGDTVPLASESSSG